MSPSLAMRHPDRRVSLAKPPRSNPTTPDTSLLLAEDNNISTREECIELCYRDSIFSDITLIVGRPHDQRLFHLHKLVIAHQSPYLFKVCTAQTPPGEEEIPRSISRVDPQTFDHVVKWLYKAKLTDRDEDIPILGRVYEAAEYLRIHELGMKVLENLRKILDREKGQREAAATQNYSSGSVSTPPAKNGTIEIYDEDAAHGVSMADKMEFKAKKMIKEIVERLTPKKNGEGSEADTGDNESSFLGSLRRRATAVGKKKHAVIPSSPMIDSPLANATPNTSMNTQQSS